MKICSQRLCKTLVLFLVLAAFVLGGMPASAGGEALLYLPVVMKPLGFDPTNMVYIPAGEFQMGCDSGCSSTGESPLHTVYLDGYYIDLYEVTNAQYDACERVGGCTIPLLRSSATRSSYYLNHAYDNYPVIYVNWHQASTYCQWMGKRLPTEAEWEKAARDASSRIYPWGNESPTCDLANGNNNACMNDTNAVGSYPDGVSPYGVFDLSGNVWEWVSDWYQASYYSESPYANPTGPATGSIKIVRGGSWGSINGLRVDYRNATNGPDKQSAGIGFRCVGAP